MLQITVCILIAHVADPLAALIALPHSPTYRSYRMSSVY